jgi:hypothetical protein
MLRVRCDMHACKDVGGRCPVGMCWEEPCVDLEGTAVNLDNRVSDTPEQVCV